MSQEAPRRVQISFLGSANLLAGSVPEKPLYQVARYLFPLDGGQPFEKETALFSLALSEYLRSRNRRPDCLLFLGTRQSNWDVLSHGLPEGDRHRVSDWVQRVMAGPLDDGKRTVDHSMLAKLPEDIRGAISCGEVLCEVVPNAVDRSGQEAFMRAVIKNLLPGDRIILDVTHGLRHLPVLSAFLLNALRWLEDVRLEDMYYGALDLRSKDGVAPVVNLRIAADYADMGAAMAVFETTGSYRALAPHFEEHRERMERVDFLEGIHRLDSAKDDALALHGAFQGAVDGEGDPYRSGVIERIRDEWRWAANDAPERHMLEQARRFLGHGEYLKCASILQEVFYIHIERLHPEADHRDPKARAKRLREHMVARGIREELSKKEAGKRYTRFDRLGQLRNALMHYRPAGGNKKQPHHSVLAALGSREKMEALLADGIDLAAWLIKKQ